MSISAIMIMFSSEFGKKGLAYKMAGTRLFIIAQIWLRIIEGGGGIFRSI